MGFTPTLSTAVWMGYKEGNILHNIHGVPRVVGGTWPARMWHDFMAEAMKGVPATEFTQPAPIESLADRAKREQRGGFDLGGRSDAPGLPGGGYFPAGAAAGCQRADHDDDHGPREHDDDDHGAAVDDDHPTSALDDDDHDDVPVRAVFDDDDDVHPRRCREENRPAYGRLPEGLAALARPAGVGGPGRALEDLLAGRPDVGGEGHPVGGEAERHVARGAHAEDLALGVEERAAGEGPGDGGVVLEAGGGDVGHEALGDRSAGPADPGDVEDPLAELGCLVGRGPLQAGQASLVDDEQRQVAPRATSTGWRWSARRPCAGRWPGPVSWSPPAPRTVR